MRTIFIKLFFIGTLHVSFTLPAIIPPRQNEMPTTLDQQNRQDLATFRGRQREGSTLSTNTLQIDVTDDTNGQDLANGSVSLDTRNKNRQGRRRNRNGKQSRRGDQNNTTPPSVMPPIISRGDTRFKMPEFAPPVMRGDIRFEIPSTPSPQTTTERVSTSTQVVTTDFPEITTTEVTFTITPGFSSTTETSTDFEEVTDFPTTMDPWTTTTAEATTTEQPYTTPQSTTTERASTSTQMIPTDFPEITTIMTEVTTEQGTFPPEQTSTGITYPTTDPTVPGTPETTTQPTTQPEVTTVPHLTTTTDVDESTDTFTNPPTPLTTTAMPSEPTTTEGENFETTTTATFSPTTLMPDFTTWTSESTEDYDDDDSDDSDDESESDANDDDDDDNDKRRNRKKGKKGKVGSWDDLYDDDYFWGNFSGDNSDWNMNFWLGNQDRDSYLWWNSPARYNGDNFDLQPLASMKEPPKEAIHRLESIKEIPKADSRALIGNIEKVVDEMYFNTKSWLHVVNEGRALNQKTMKKLKQFDRVIDFTYKKISNEFLTMPDINGMNSRGSVSEYGDSLGNNNPNTFDTAEKY